MKKFLAMLLALAMVFALAACGRSAAPAATETPAAGATEAPAAEAPAEEPEEIIVFAAASMTETLNQIKEIY